MQLLAKENLKNICTSGSEPPEHFENLGILNIELSHFTHVCKNDCLLE